MRKRQDLLCDGKDFALESWGARGLLRVFSFFLFFGGGGGGLFTNAM